MFNKMKIKSRIMFGFSFVLLITLLVTWSAMVSYWKMGVNSQAWAMLIFGLLAFSAGIVVEVTLIKDITAPVKDIVDITTLMAKGDVDVAIKKRQDNELGQVVEEINAIASETKKRAEIAREIAKGNLAIEVKPDCEKDILGNALYELVNRNNEVMSGIKESTMQVTAGAEQVADASQALAQGSTEQASAIEQVTASMEEIAEKTKANASQATSADEIVHNVKTEATKGNDQMKEMIDAMREINDSSENISKVIKVINDIAFQTNILALNATVEAARAGVHGKGFAVVAEEVRNLAEKSDAAANETNDMIQDSIRKVKNGSALAEDTAKALETIVAAIEKVVVLIDSIATASSDQATAVTQINQAINQVSQVVQTNSATSEQCAAASEELASQAEALRDLISKFKLKDAGSGKSYFAQTTQHAKADIKASSRTENEKIISLDGGYGKY